MKTYEVILTCEPGKMTVAADGFEINDGVARFWRKSDEESRVNCAAGIPLVAAIANHYWTSVQEVAKEGVDAT